MRPASSSNALGDSAELPELHVPQLPTLLRYVDDFTGKEHTCRLGSNEWLMYAAGSRCKFSFDECGADVRPLLKYIMFELTRTGSIETAYDRLLALRRVEPMMRRLILGGPPAVKPLWAELLAAALPQNAYTGLKTVLRTCCELSILEWSPLWLDLLPTLPLPKVDKYVGVRTGDVFISVDEERAIIRSLDERSQRAAQLSFDEATDAVLILCSYQFGMRPIQIGMLQRANYRARSSDDGTTSVHLTFKMVKQQDDRLKNLPLVRKVKREWAPLVVSLHNHGSARGLGAKDSLLGLSSAHEVGRRLSRALAEISISDRTATDLRHSAAQRLVDAGASSEELAEFMAHSDTTTGLVYFDTSASQAERINRALGISETYSTIARIAHAEFISEEELSHLKQDQQIAGVPHGIPISGIGGCKTGQPSCPYNPVTACYGCYKFMPVKDVALHKQVLADFRSVVSFFVDASRSEIASPAYMQLKGTIASVQTVIDELEGRLPND